VEKAPLAAAAALVAYFALVPLAYLLVNAFGQDGGLTLEHFREAYGGARLGPMAGSSLIFATGSSLLAVASGTAIAFLVVRTDLPLRRVIFAISLLPLIVPGILYTIAWILLASPGLGALDEAIPVNAYGMGGMVLVEGLQLSPLVLLLMAAAFTAMDGTLEEAALMSGARPATVLRRVTLPLVRPALYAALLVMAIRALEAFEVPALLGIPGGTWVFTSRIWQALDTFPANIDRAAAYSVPLLLITLVAVSVYWRVVGRTSRYQTVGGRATPPRRIALGRWSWLAAALIGCYLLVAVAAPLLVLLYASTQRFYSHPSVQGLSHMTGANWGSLFDAPTAHAIGNSLLLAAGTATAVTFVMAAVAWLVVRGSFRGRWALDGLASLPLVIPGLVLGVALQFVYLRSPVPVYGTLWIIFIAYFTRFMPYGLRFAASAMHQIGDDLEEAARMSGASWWQAFRRIMLPLVRPGLVAGWVYVAIVGLRELSASILLYSPGTEVLPVRIFVLYEGGQLTELAALGLAMTLLSAILAAVAWRVGGRLGFVAQ
jgi:iron(III) transport system permease protein